MRVRKNRDRGLRPQPNEGDTTLQDRKQRTSISCRNRTYRARSVMRGLVGCEGAYIGRRGGAGRRRRPRVRFAAIVRAFSFSDIPCLLQLVQKQVAVPSNTASSFPCPSLRRSVSALVNAGNAHASHAYPYSVVTDFALKETGTSEPVRIASEKRTLTGSWGSRRRSRS